MKVLAVVWGAYWVAFLIHAALCLAVERRRTLAAYTWQGPRYDSWKVRR